MNSSDLASHQSGIQHARIDDQSVLDTRRRLPIIVIIGAGFGGLNAAKALARLDVAVVLVDRANYHLFQPLLYQVATSALSASDIAAPVRSMFRGHDKVTVVLGDVTGIDTAAKCVHIAETQDLPYDYLIVATGSHYNWFGHPEWSQFATSLKSLDDADLIRFRTLTSFDWAESRSDPSEKKKLTSFVIIGGGPTGVELAGALAELARFTLKRDFRHIDSGSARIILCDAGDRLLSGFPPKLADYAHRSLTDLGVDIRLKTSAEEIEEGSVTLAGERIECANVFWCAGTKAEPAAAWLSAPAAKNGAIEVTETCSVPGHPEIFAIGDVASFTDKKGKPLPGLAPVAKQQGSYVAKVIRSRIEGRAPPKPFRYRNYGTLAVIGRSRAVADFGWIRLSGFPAWLTWSMIHLLLLVGFRNRILVYINWAWSFFTYNRGARLAIGSYAHAKDQPVKNQA